MPESVLQVLIRFISEMADISEDQIKKTSTISGLGLDSLDKTELAFNIERHYDLLIPDDELEEVKTVKDFEEVINKALEFKKSRK
jgi:acyl carrier protein